MLRGRPWSHCKNTTHVWQAWRVFLLCGWFFFFGFFLRHPRFSLGSSALTHSAFAAAGGLSAEFIHITGVKRGRSHNEAQLLVEIYPRSESKKLQPFCYFHPPGEIFCGWSPQRSSGQWSLCIGVNLPAHWKLGEMCRRCARSGKLTCWDISTSRIDLFYLLLWLKHKLINSFRFVVIKGSHFVGFNSAVLRRFVLTRKNFLMAYWSAVLPGDSSQLIWLILSRSFWWGSTELTWLSN